MDLGIHITDSLRFRWAFCQLDILKRLNTIPDIRKALGELPRTLDETYERILCSIPLENHSIAYRTLQLLAFDLGIRHLGALLDALAVDVERCTFSRDDRILDRDALLEVCTCLITITPEKDRPADKNYFRVQLAHYTVKEYLVSNRIGRGSATTFQMSEESVFPFAARCFITYMLHEDYHRLPDQHRECLMKVAIDHWDSLVRGIHSHAARAAITPLVLKLLDVTSPHFQNWIEAHRELPINYIMNTPQWTVTPGGESCLILAYLCYFDLYEAAQQFVENLSGSVPFETEIKTALLPEHWEFPTIAEADDMEDGKLLHIAVFMGRVAFVKYFMSKGADVNAISAKGISVLGAAVCSGFYICYPVPNTLEIVELLLKAGADPNIAGVWFTPLQRLMFDWSNYQDISVTIAKALLDSGAEVNGVGDDESNISRLLVTVEDYCLQNRQNTYACYEFEDLVTSRETEWNYDSPLRIVDNHMQRTATSRDGELDRLTKMKGLLISHGARAFHQSPKFYPSANIQARIQEHLRSIG